MPASNQDNNDKKKSHFEERVKVTVDNIKDSDFYNFASGHKEQSIILLLLILGLLLLFFRPFLGALLLGGIGGYYFSSHIFRFFKQVASLFNIDRHFHDIILAILALAIFIISPGMIIGGFIGALIGRFKNLKNG